MWPRAGKRPHLLEIICSNELNVRYSTEPQIPRQCKYLCGIVDRKAKRPCKTDVETLWARSPWPPRGLNVQKARFRRRDGCAGRSSGRRPRGGTTHPGAMWRMVGTLGAPRAARSLQSRMTPSRCGGAGFATDIAHLRWRRGVANLQTKGPAVTGPLRCQPLATRLRRCRAGIGAGR